MKRIFTSNCGEEQCCKEIIIHTKLCIVEYLNYYSLYGLLGNYEAQSACLLLLRTIFVPTVINFTKEVMQIILVENIFTIKLAYILEKYLMKKI